MRPRILLSLCLLCGVLSLSCCAGPSAPESRTVRVVLEEGEGFIPGQSVFDLPAGGDVRVRIAPREGWQITGCDYEGALLETDPEGQVLLTLPGVRYTRTVKILAEKNPYVIRYHLGREEKGEGPETVLERTYPASHLRINTLAGSPDGFLQDAREAKDKERIPLIVEDGSALLCGWNTSPGGKGTEIGLGSRIKVPENKALDLYADWRPFTDPSLFDYALLPGGGARITGFRGQAEELVLPADIDGHPVTSIGERAFSGISCACLVLPPTLREVGLYAFENASLSSLTFFDTLSSVTDYAFSGCENLREIRIQAAMPPAWSGTYYDTFTDKMDRLRLLKDKKKILLFSGSSARFGYDCERIDAAYPEYSVVNLGVFAYTNALPQLDLILLFSGEGDLLVHTPEFDAASRQFCCTNAMDSAFFRMIESDYDLLSLLDYRDYGGLLSAYASFHREREGMKAGDYRISASSFDEDGHPVSEPSYNEYGDYVVPRPNAEDDAPIYDLPVDYTKGSFAKDRFIDPLNRVYRRFLDKGVTVCFDYAPRNREALSDKSTRQARRELDAWLRESLCVPVLEDIEDSLYPGRYLFGTDNHLSDEGVQIRTDRFLKALEALREKGGEK